MIGKPIHEQGHCTFPQPRGCSGTRSHPNVRQGREAHWPVRSIRLKASCNSRAMGILTSSSSTTGSCTLQMYSFYLLFKPGKISADPETLSLPLLWAMLLRKCQVLHKMRVQQNSLNQQLLTSRNDALLLIADKRVNVKNTVASRLENVFLENFETLTEFMKNKM